MGEKIVTDFYRKKYNLKFIAESEGVERPYWDLKFKKPDDSILKVEVKTDVHVIPGRHLGKFWVQPKDSGNIYVEAKRREFDSGITITESDMWANLFYYLNEIWFIKVSKLRELIKNNNFYLTHKSGDENSSGYLIPREEFREHFIVKKI